MAESPSQASATTPTTPTASDSDTTQYWCYHCEKRVCVETLANLTDVICLECKTGFVEPIPAAMLPPFSPTSLSPDHVDDPAFGSQFLQVLRLLAQAASDEDTPPWRTQDPQPEEDIFRIELDAWENDDDYDDANENDDNDENRNNEEEDENEEEEENEEGEDRLDNGNEENNREIDEEEDLRRRRRDVLRLRIRDFATRARMGRNRILDWAEILMGLEDNSIEFRLEVPESDRYVGNPEDYVDAAGYEALLQNLAESDGGRRGAPPASKSSVSDLLMVEILFEQETVVCAICKDMIAVGEKAMKLPCGHSYHGDCILSWLGLRNSCPVCRFELPTDDPEYEEERKKRMTAIVGGASTSARDNSSLG